MPLPATSPIEENLALEEVELNVYRSTQSLWKPPGARGIFGGAVISQALSAATKTVEEVYVVHSLHSYFLLPGDVSIPILYIVERVRDGKSFTTRSVEAIQRGRCICHLVASFQRPEDSALSHTTPFPTNIPNLETLPSDFELLSNKKFYSKISISEKERLMALSYIERGPIENRRVLETPEEEKLAPYLRKSRGWLKAQGKIQGSCSAHAIVLAYLSDKWFLSTSVKVNDAYRKVSLMASLDHIIYFHTHDFKADEWMFFEMESPWTGNGRGLNFGRLYSRDGRLIATCIQEGLIRLHEDRKTSERPKL
ncbi:Acyl-coenzyme A thioesterase 8 [Neolecta irregularis DAH-3]|uniref:Acyl-coenzyme A thioesterase 8 n=1 Tax=Neolecta irregularis (strain DAH-3) TaxID=1198029 RepID=A0A1U7LSH8_NEOID|nr:Acyl-coenzyme A thioesterase 8 [Neolecta irregularis DAH-3]|eukprot:OLL25617.1 Acyl-coenzyme A thioesterase 8 [Neolecta irregularis DAH-3]